MLATLIAATFIGIPSHTVPPCEYEDGSSQKVCIWDGQHMGNGIGRSVIIRNGGYDNMTVRFITHRNAHRLLTTH